MSLKYLISSLTPLLSLFLDVWFLKATFLVADCLPLQLWRILQSRVCFNVLLFKNAQLTASSNCRVEDPSPDNIEERFSKVYRTQAWLNDPTELNPEYPLYSGTGSHVSSVVIPYVCVMKDFLSSFAVRPDVVDLGAGDFNVGSQLVEHAARYVAVDVVEDVLAQAQMQYAHIIEKHNVEFHHLNIVREPLPLGYGNSASSWKPTPANLRGEGPTRHTVVTIRQVFGHLHNDEIRAVLRKLPGNDYTFLVVTESVPAEKFVPNQELSPGAGFRDRVPNRSGVDVTARPFHLQTERSWTLLEVDDPDRAPGDTIIRTTIHQLKPLGSHDLVKKFGQYRGPG